MTRSFGDLVAASVGVSSVPEVFGIAMPLARIHDEPQRPDNDNRFGRRLVVPVE